VRYIVDLHIHSRFSRACSKNLTLSNLAAWAAVKGIDVLGTSDFTHPAWRKEIEERLQPAEDGLFRLKPEYRKEDGEGSYEPAPETRDTREVRFMLTSEVSCIYKKNGRTRRLHVLIFMPTLAGVDAFNAALEARKCNLRADGRPILGVDAKEIVRLAIEADPHAMVVPAHAWTPWFSVFGSESGFDSLEECFEGFTPHIKAIETGLSSDPQMNHRLSKLDNIALISNSDAHGVRNLGREANAIDVEHISYDAVIAAITNTQSESVLLSQQKFLYTIEFFPEEGKYHVDGHRACNFFCEPEQTIKMNGLCPKCHKALTRGVMGRVQALADRPLLHNAQQFVAQKNIIPFEELLGDCLGKTKASKAVQQLYRDALKKLGPEFTILLDRDEKEILAAIGQKPAEAIAKMRRGDISIKPGYDGVYGTIKIFEK
jgi:uncharacterized protein (TIGR00375 family)